MSAGRPLAIHAQGVRVARGEREVLCGLDLSLAEGESACNCDAHKHGSNAIKRHRMRDSVRGREGVVAYRSLSLLPEFRKRGCSKDCERALRDHAMAC